MAVFLPPLPFAVGVIPVMCNHQGTVSLRLSQKLTLVGDNYTVDDAGTGQPVLRVIGKALSFHNRKRRWRSWVVCV
jgi:uncharacterized protein YxjI